MKIFKQISVATFLFLATAGTLWVVTHAYAQIQFITAPLPPVQQNESAQNTNQNTATTSPTQPTHNSTGVPDENTKGPWNNDLVMLTSTDGNTFSKATMFEERAGVPSVIADADGRLIAAFQWFPEDDTENFDKVAVKISEDDGATWTEPTKIEIDGLPETYVRPFDPTLALTEDGFIRIYFTSNPETSTTFNDQTAIYSALSTDGIHYTFEEGVRFDVPEKPNYDSAALLLNDTWHITTPAGAPSDGVFHGTSKDGLTFTVEDTIPSVNNMNWTGNLIPYEDGMRFYGGCTSICWTYSADGFTWTDPTILTIKGGDPAIVQLSDGTYLLTTVN